VYARYGILPESSIEHATERTFDANGDKFEAMGKEFFEK
jgi:hypothetical protein